MKKELAWLLCPILAIANQLSGTWGSPWGWASILAIAVFLQLYGKLRTWQGYTTLALFWVLQTLPITLGGDSVVASWYSLLWVWLLGYIQGLWFAICNRRTFLYALFPMVLYGVWITLSNVSATANLFPWKFCEGIMGFALGIPFALAIGDEK